MTDLFGNEIEERAPPPKPPPEQPKILPKEPPPNYMATIRPCTITKESRDVTWIMNT